MVILIVFNIYILDVSDANNSQRVKRIKKKNANNNRVGDAAGSLNNVIGDIKMEDVRVNVKLDRIQKQREIESVKVGEMVRRQQQRQQPLPPPPPPPLPPPPTPAPIPSSFPSSLVPLPSLLTSPSCPTKTCLPLITGCGRSGTHFMAEEIMANSIPIKHERIGEAGSVSWIYGAPHVPSLRKLETWFASEEDTRKREDPEFAFFPQVHVVRHPIKAITSLVACFCGCGSMSCGAWADEPSWEWAGKHLDFTQKGCRNWRREGLCLKFEKEREGRLRRAVEYWVGWNDMVEEGSHYRIRMEDYKLQELMGIMGWEGYVKAGGVKQKVFTRKSKTVKHNQVTWREIEELGDGLKDKVMERARKYGYGEEPPEN